MEHTGWIKIHRKMVDWEWFGNHKVFRLFICLLIHANYKPGKFMGIDIPVGSLVTSVQKLEMITGLSGQSIRTALDKLKSTGEITIKTTNKFTIVTITNYADYQADDSTMQQAEQQTNNNQITNKQQSNNKQITTIEEIKKNKKEKNDKNITKAAAFDFLSALISSGVNDVVARDYMSVRKAKRASNTSTAFDSLVREAQKANRTLEEIVIICIERNWITAKAEWLRNSISTTDVNPHANYDDRL